jgi:hypothetical protein
MVEQNQIQEWIRQLRSDNMDQQREASAASAAQVRSGSHP